MGTGVGDNNSSNGNNNGACHMRTQFGVVRTTSAKHGSNDNEDDDVDMNRAVTALTCSVAYSDIILGYMDFRAASNEMRRIGRY